MKQLRCIPISLTILAIALVMPRDHVVAQVLAPEPALDGVWTVASQSIRFRFYPRCRIYVETALLGQDTEGAEFILGGGRFIPFRKDGDWIIGLREFTSRENREKAENALALTRTEILRLKKPERRRAAEAFFALALIGPQAILDVLLQNRDSRGYQLGELTRRLEVIRFDEENMVVEENGQRATWKRLSFSEYAALPDSLPDRIALKSQVLKDLGWPENFHRTETDRLALETWDYWSIGRSVTFSWEPGNLATSVSTSTFTPVH